MFYLLQLSHSTVIHYHIKTIGYRVYITEELFNLPIDGKQQARVASVPEQSTRADKTEFVLINWESGHSNLRYYCLHLSFSQIRLSSCNPISPNCIAPGFSVLF